MALVVALPLFIWGIIFGNFNLSKKAVSGEPNVPTPINWSAGNVQITADDFYVVAPNGKTYKGNNVTVIPGTYDNTSTSIEVRSTEFGDDTRIKFEFKSDNYNWWLENVSAYNSNYSNNYITYHGPFLQGYVLGYSQPLPGNNYYHVTDPNNGQFVADVYFSNAVVQAFVGRTPPPTAQYTPSPTATATSYPTATPSPSGNVTQLFTFKMKFVGVTDGSADGAKVNIRFQNPTIGFDYFTSPVQVHHVANGVYETSVIFGTATPTLPTNGGYVISLKGEKHLATRFCQQSGQTLRCSGNWTIPVPLPAYNPSAFVFDFTGIALEPGDLYQQDGTANSADFTKIKDLLSKPCANLTATEKLTADIDYSGCVNVRDAFLMRQTLQTRYDEN